MSLNWRRGLLRLWVVASVVWFIVVFFLVTYESSQTAERFARLTCKREELTSEEFHECHRHTRTPAGMELYRLTRQEADTSVDAAARDQKIARLRVEMERDRTWAWSYFREQWPFFAAAPFVFLLFGAIIAHTIAWVGRGFV